MSTTARKPCSRCGAPKSPGPGRRLCDACMEADALKHRCARCGGEKPRGAGRRLCDDCDRAKKAVQIAPCHKCGERKPKKRGVKFCDECAEGEKWRAERRRRGKRAMERKACRGCGKPKGDGKRRIYCDACMAERAKPRTCPGCGERPITTPRAKRCDVCRTTAADRRRSYRRAYVARKLAEDPAFRERMRETERRSRRKALERRRTSSSERAEYNERRRINYRLKRADELGSLDAVRITPARSGGRDLRVSVPSGQLLAVLDAAAARAAVDVADNNGGGRMNVLCERIGLSERVVLGWRLGERPRVEVTVADRVLVDLNLNWWDVWNEDTVRLPLIRVALRRPRRKQKDGVERMLWERGYRDYGDAGPDHEALAQIARAWEGEEAVAA